MRRKSNQVSLSNDISKIINITNSKYIAAALMIIFTLYHIRITMNLDNNSCKYLLMDGHYLSNYNWQPYGCMMHNYTTKDSQFCFNYIAFWGGSNQITFFGDIYLREFYHNLVNHISGKLSPVSMSLDNSPKHLEVKQISLRGEFIDIKDLNFSSVDLLFSHGKSSQNKKAKSYFIMSFGLELFNTSANITLALTEFEKQVRDLSKFIQNSRSQQLGDIKFIWMLLEHSYYEDIPYLYEYIEKCNSLASDILIPQRVLIWQSNLKIYQQLSTILRNYDDLYIRRISVYWYTQIYLNLYCNDVMKFQDGTCCRKEEEIKTVQIATFVFFVICSLIAAYCFVYNQLCLNSMNRIDVRKTKSFVSTHHRSGSDILPLNTSFLMALKDVSYSFSRLALILAYFFVCDRTMFFMKENKAYTTISFLLPLAYVFVVGIFFTDNSQLCGILNRDITDEWKGWLQCVILMYHITGASKILPIYFMVRICVSSYLFMTGYGHFTYFYTKGDISFRRFLIVQYRLNFITVCLCLTMNRSYQLYYFVPLISVAFVFIYLFFAIIPVSLASLRPRYLIIIIVLKIILLMVFISLLYNYNVLFDKLFYGTPLRSLFVISEEHPNEWKFRWSLDRYSYVIGMIYGLIYHTMRQNNFLLDNNNLDVFSIRVSCFLFGSGILGIFVYLIFALTVSNKITGTQLHPYIAFIPIFGYVIVRNIFGSMRKKYSSFFAGIGKVSLELYVAQYHIWLAADAHGILVLLPGYPILNLILTTFIFFCTAHELHCITVTLLPYIIPDTWRAYVRNIIIFVIIMLPWFLYQTIAVIS